MRLQIETSDQILDYVREHTPSETEVLRELREVTSEMPLHLMQVSPEQGNFLGVFVRSLGARRVLEVGVFTGYSLISMAAGLPKEGTVVGLEIDEEWAGMAREYADKAGLGDRVEVQVGPAKESMERMLQEGAAGTFDLVFIDADKEGYKDYLELGLKLLRSGGSVLVDNVLWHGALLDPEAQDSETVALRAFNEYVSTELDESVRSSMFPYADGMTLLVKP